MGAKAISLAICCTMFAFAGCNSAQADEIKKLVGQWKIVKVEGGEIPEDENIRIVTITDKKITLPAGTKKHITLPYTIDSTKSPKWMDIQVEGLTSPGIYKLDDDKLTVVVINQFKNDKPPPRPTTFEGEIPGVVLHLERIKSP